MRKNARTFINLINAADSCHRTFFRNLSNDDPQAHLNKLWKETNPFRYDFHFFESPLTEVMKSFTKETV